MLDKGQEIEWVKATSEGSYRSFTNLYEHWAPKLFSFVYSLTKSKSISKDIVQESFIKVWDKRETLNPSFSFKSYLFTISYRITLKHFRKQVNSPVMEDYLLYTNDSSHSHSGADETIHFEEFVSALKTAKEKLTSRQKQIFELVKEQDATITEVADQFDITEQSVRNQLSTSLKVLRNELSTYYFLFLLFLIKF